MHEFNAYLPTDVFSQNFFLMFTTKFLFFIKIGKLLCESFWRSTSFNEMAIFHFREFFRVFNIKLRILNAIKSAPTAAGAIKIKSVNALKVTWDNIVKRHFVIHNA